MHGRKDLMTRTILRSLFDRLGNTAAKWAACLLATVCISSAWGATTVAKIGDTEYRSLQDAVNKVTNGQTIRLVADCDEPVLVARDVSFSIVPDSGIAFTGSIEKGSDDTAITATDGENGAKSYMVVLQDLKYPWTTEGQAQLQACIKKAWEKPQEGLYIAGRKIRKSGRFDGEGYSDAEGPITVDLENHTIALNSATITVNSSPVQTYVKTSTASASNGRSENVVDNSVPYEGVVCLNEVSYAHPGSGRNDNTTRDYYWWLLGYNMASDNMATAGIAILDDNAWTLTLVGENKVQVNAAFSYPSGSYTTAGCAYGIYAKGNLTVVKGNGESVGNLVADITNNGTGNYQSANYYPGNSAVCSMGNLTISEGTAISAVLDGTMTATVNGTEYTTQNFAKYGAIYAATNVTISGATVAATNKLVSSAAGYGNGVSAIGSRYGNITIDGSAVDAVCLGQYQALVSGEMVTAYRGQGISTYGAYGAYTTVEIKGGADVNIEAGFSGIDGNGGVTISGQGTVVDVDVVGDGNGIAASQGTYQISEASVTVNAAVAVAQNYKTGSIISTGDYSSSVPANAVAANTYQYYQNGMYHLTDTIPTGWVAYYDGTFYMDPGSSAEAIALCGEGKSVYINEDSSAAKTGIGEGRNFTVYVLEGKSYTGAVTSERLVSNLTTGDATEFDGKTYVPNTFTMSVDPEHAVAKIVEADGATTYYASMTTSYSSPRYTGAASSLKADDTLVILEDVALTSSLSKSVDWTLDLNGRKLTCGSNYYVSQSSANRTLTIKDSSAAQTGVIHQTYVPSNNSSAWSGVRCSNGTIVIESGRFTGGNTPVVATGSGVIEIRGGYFDGALYVATYSPGTYVCYGGIYTVDPVKHVADGYAAAKTVVDETDLWVVGRLDITKTVTPVSDVSAEYVISASIYDADDNLITKLAEDQTIAVSIDTTKDMAGSTLAKFNAEKVVTTALLNAEDSSKITAIAISVQSAMTNKVESINNSTKERLGTAVYYDVKPVAEVAAAGADSTAFTIANDAIADGAEFAFDLVLPEIEGVEVGTVLTVTHISAGYNNETTYDIAKADSNDGLYVSAATTHFSTFRVNYSIQSATAKLLTVSGNADFITTSYLETDIATAVSKVGQKGTVGKVVLLSDFTLNESVSVTKPVASETIVDLNGHTITLAEGVENAFVISGEGTMLTVKNGTVPVGISGYPENYVLFATAADDATTYKAAAAVAQIGTTKYETLDAAIDAAGSSGTTITLLDDAELGVDTIAKSFKIESNGRKITLSNDVTLNTGKTIIAFTDLTIDLAGHAISASGTGKIQCGEYYHKVSTLTIEDSATGGKITGGNYSSAPLTQYGNGSIIVLKDDVAVNGTYLGITSGGGQIIVNDSATVYGGTYGVKNTATSDGVTDLYYSGEAVSGGTLAAWGPAEATIGGKTYYAKTVSALVSKVPSDGTEYTITAHSSDATLSGTVVQGGQRIVVDLGSCVSSLRDDVKIYEGHLTIRNGTVNYGSQDRLIMLYSSADDTKNAGEYNSLTIAEDAKITTTVVVYPSGYNTSSESNKAYGTKVTINGEIVGTDSGAISINGVAHEGNSIIEVNGTVRNDKDLAIYLAGHGTTYINAGAMVVGTTGIEVRAGELRVIGGTITGTGASASNVANNSGASTSGAGIAVAQHTTQLPISVNVSGGTITGASSLYVVNPQGNTSENAIDVSVSGNAAFSGEVVVTDARADVEIVGGIYSIKPEATHIASGYAAMANTDATTSAAYPWAVGKPVAQIDSDYYATFADAITAAEAYKTEHDAYPTIAVLDATAEQANPDWKIADGYLVRKVYVAQIGTTKYESLAEAYGNAASGDTIEMIADDRLSEELAISRSVTITGAVDEDGKPLYTIYGKPTDNYNVDVFIKNASSAIDVTIQNVNISEFGHKYSTLTGNGALYVSRTTHADTHVLVSNVTFSAYNNYAIIAPQGHVEVVDCAIDGYKDPSYGALCTGGVWSGDMFDEVPTSTVSVKRTVIINLDSNMSGTTAYAIDARAGSTFVVEDCTISNVRDGIAAVAGQESGTGSTSVSVSRTTVDAARNALAISGNPKYLANAVIAELTVSSGTYVGAVALPEQYEDYGIIEISGGYFSQYIVEDFCASGHLCTTKPVKDALYQVVPAKRVTYTMGENPPTGAALPSPASFAYPSGDMAEIALTPATCTDVGYTFAGWKVSGEGDAVAVLPAGTTVDITLVATWTGVKTVTITESATDVPIKVTDEWIGDNVTPAAGTATTEEIQQALNKEEANGNKAWENYVLGLDGSNPNAKLAADAAQGPVSATPITSNVDVPPVDTGFKVEYKLVSLDTNGTTVTQSALQPTPDLTADIAAMTSETNVVYYKTVAVITSTSDDSVKVEVPSTNTIGVLKVAAAPATAMIAVPWAALDGDGDISAANLVRTANLTVGDELHYYKNGMFQSWTLGADGTWQSTKNVSDSGTTDGDAASAATIPRGSAVWLKRQDASKPVYLVGEVGTGTAKTALEGGTENAPAWNMVASPSVEELDISAKFSSPNANDRIVVPTDGAPKNYFLRNGKWGYTETTVYEDGVETRFVEVGKNETLPAGTGFWYLNSGDPKDITWTSGEEGGAEEEGD